MRTEGNATSYVGGTESRPLPAPDLTYRPSVQAEAYVCPECGWRARKKAFHLCVTPEPTPAAKRRSKPFPVVELTAEQVEKRFTPDAPAPVASIPVVVDHAAEPGTVELRNHEGETVARIVEEPRPRVRAKVTAAKPGPGVLIALSGEISTVEVTALLTDLLTGLNAVEVRALAPVEATPGRRRTPRKPGGPGGKLAGHEQTIIERYQAGESGKEIARDFDCSSNAITQMLRRLGVQTRDRGDAQRGRHQKGSGRTLTPEQIAEAVERYNAGASMDEVANHFDVPFSTMRARLIHGGASIRPARRPRRTS